MARTSQITDVEVNGPSLLSLKLSTAANRVSHGYRFTHGFQAKGLTVMVTVPDFDTRRQTVLIPARPPKSKKGLRQKNINLVNGLCVLNYRQSS